MNAYLIQDDEEQTVWIAESAAEAIELAFDDHLERCDQHEGRDPEWNYRKAWDNQCFQSCKYVGPVGNKNVFQPETMVEFARRKYPRAGDWLVGDAEHLPLASQSVDLVFSSLAIQWCARPHLLFAELARVLRPGGRCLFTSLGPDTLRELRTS